MPRLRIKVQTKIPEVARAKPKPSRFLRAPATRRCLWNREARRSSSKELPPFRLQPAAVLQFDLRGYFSQAGESNALPDRPRVLSLRLQAPPRGRSRNAR